MTRLPVVPLIFLLLSISSAALGADDVIVLKNGDRLTGEILKMTDGKLVLKTAFAGEVTIDWKEVASLQSDVERPVKLSGGQAATGHFVSGPEGVTFESEDWASRGPFPLDQVASISEPPPPAAWNACSPPPGAASTKTTSSPAASTCAR